MVGNMVGTSLAMAPAFILGQQCDIVDLDGPIFLRGTASPGVVYEDGHVDCPDRGLGRAGRGAVNVIATPRAPPVRTGSASRAA